MKEFIKKLIERLEETDLHDIQMVVREVLSKYGFPYESVVQDEVWDALDELSTNKFTIKIVNQLAEEYKGGWIPCSERLPDESGEYYTYVCYEGSYIYAIDDIDCDGVTKQWNCVSDYHIIAWKPIAPYKEGE